MNIPTFISLERPENLNKYSKDDLVSFKLDICFKIGLNTISKILNRFDFSEAVFKYVLKTIANYDEDQDRSPQLEGIIISNVTKSAKEFHAQLYNVLYVVKVNELPLLLNCDESLAPIVKWRIERGK